MYRTVLTPTLEIAYLETGPRDGAPVVLLHGWPSDVHDWDDAAQLLSDSGLRLLSPWLRGFGPTRFLASTTRRSGQQGAIASDLRDFMNALSLQRVFLAGYDWGGRAACIVAALWPERVLGLVSVTGYNIQNIPRANLPDDTPHEHRYWYQWYFQTQRGHDGLARNRREIARFLWHAWSPNWQFDDATFDATATSFDNADFVEVSIHSYRHRYGNATGDPAFDDIEDKLARQPPIAVPAIVLHGACDGVTHPNDSLHAEQHFSNHYERRLIPVAGHFLSRERADEVVKAIHDLIRISRASVF
jgi:pimeloyl-ACP methyl ester carboxylesterase